MEAVHQNFHFTLIQKTYCREIIAVSHCHANLDKCLIASPNNSSLKRMEQCDKEREPGFVPVLRGTLRLSCFTKSVLTLPRFQARSQNYERRLSASSCPSVCLSVCPSPRMEQLCSYWTDLHEI